MKLWSDPGNHGQRPFFVKRHGNFHIFDRRKFFVMRSVNLIMLLNYTLFLLRSFEIMTVVSDQLLVH